MVPEVCIWLRGRGRERRASVYLGKRKKGRGKGNMRYVSE